MKVVAFPAKRASSQVDVLPGGHSRGARRRTRKDTLAAESGLYPQGLTTSFWFDSGSGNCPYSATVRFSGRRVGATGRLGRRDSFIQDEVVEGVVPGTGPVSVSARVYDVNPGEWTVTAEMLRPSGGPRSARPAMRLGPRGSQRLYPTAWSWRRWALSAGPAKPLKTRWVPLTNFERIPAVIPGSWAVLVLLGVLVGLAVQAVLVSQVHLDAARVLAVSGVASLAGLAGAKAWYVALNLKDWREALRVGLCIQGFLVAAVAVALSGLWLLRLAIGPVLDATAPGLFFGVTIGRFGCFLTGCCAGRHSVSRWAIWSSDRRVGARRIPTQLLESLAALCIAIPALLAVMYSRPAVPGTIFLASCAAYTLARQGLLRLRRGSRRSSLAGPLTAAAAAIVLVASLSSAFLGVSPQPL